MLKMTQPLVTYLNFLCLLISIFHIRCAELKETDLCSQKYLRSYSITRVTCNEIIQKNCVSSACLFIDPSSTITTVDGRRNTTFTTLSDALEAVPPGRSTIFVINPTPEVQINVMPGMIVSTEVSIRYNSFSN